MLAPHFTMAEVTRSSTAKAKGIDNSVPIHLNRNIGRIAEFMECVRWYLGDVPIIVSSWYRCPTLNKAIGGSQTSAHMKGLAMDFSHSVLALEEVFVEIKGSRLPYDQLIIEGTKGKAEWIHLGLSEDAPRLEAMTASRDFTGGPMIFTRIARD